MIENTGVKSIMENNEEKKTRSTVRKVFIGGCVLPLFLAVILCLGLSLWFALKPEKPAKPPEYIKKIEPQIEKKLDYIKKAEKKFRLKKAPGPSYDIDKTVQALYSIERTLLEAKTFEELTNFMLQKDSDKIATDVAKLKYRFFNIYKKLLDAKDDLEDTESIYNIATGSLLDVLSSIDYTMGGINHEQVKKVWRKRMKEADARDKIRKRIGKFSGELLDFYFDYMKLSSRYHREWDKLCSVRDRAYLAIYEGDWNEAVKAAGAAVKVAPYEKEAHILLAMSLLERGGETDRAQGKELIESYLKKHQGQEAPAYLLRGVIAMKNENREKAIIDFDQAAAYYPKQQEELLSLLNLYKKRSFLNKSKEGRVIINMYRGIMTGSGYFSPDFQKAGIHAKENQNAKARKKIFDHFFRRRLQGQWDKVLTDFRYCGKYLDTELYEIAEAEKINLRIDSAFFSNSVIVSIYNASTRDIHNVTLLLCVRFTDMFKGDYISFPVGETLSILKSGEEVTVGRENITGITKEKLGEVKEFKDIIDFAAVLISDEVITWVDSKPAKHIDELPASAKTATLAREIAGLAASLSETKELTDDEKRKNKEIAGGIIKLLLSSVGSGQMNKADKEKITAEAKKLTENLTGKAIDFITKGISANGEFDAKQKSSIKKIKELVKSLIREAVRGIPKNQNTEKKSK